MVYAPRTPSLSTTLVTVYVGWEAVSWGEASASVLFRGRLFRDLPLDE